MTARETPRSYDTPRVIPQVAIALRPAPWRPDFPRPARSQRRDLNPQPADYKSAALPIELRWPNIQLAKTSKYNEGPLSCNTDGRKNAVSLRRQHRIRRRTRLRPTSLPEWVGHPTSTRANPPTRHATAACPATTSPLPAKKHLPCELDPLSRGTLEMAVRWNARRTAEQDALRPTCDFPSCHGPTTKKIHPAWDPAVRHAQRSPARRTPAADPYSGNSMRSSWAACRSLFSARASICRTRSFVTPISWPTSFSVSGSWR